MTTIGVLAYQGDFARHIYRLKELGVEAEPVRDTESFARVDGLIIPGGESTTIGLLLSRFGLLEAIRNRITTGFPVFGTCAGAILLADTIEGSDQPHIGGLDMGITRNAYGPQIESFEADLKVVDCRWSRWSDGPVHGVFIRAPIIARTGENATTLVEFENRPVLVQQHSLLAATFHPELTSDDRVHRYFLEEVVRL